jgi:hypothetical protein
MPKTPAIILDKNIFWKKQSKAGKKLRPNKRRMISVYTFFNFKIL